MATKDEMATELAEHGHEVETDDYSWDELADMVRQVREASSEPSQERATEGHTPAPARPGEYVEPRRSDEAPAASQGPEKRYRVELLQHYPHLVGVPLQLIAVARHRGMFGAEDGTATIDEVVAAVGQLRESEVGE